tara:strand:+ start:3348 stop:4280 length:933 start_codon:yes stop_codon:yes gene_type:complete
MIKIFIVLLILNINFLVKANSIENKILLKIDNKIITSIDVFNETKYLMAINEKINQMKQEDIYKISLNYLIKERIKKIEIEKNISRNKLDVNENYLNELIKNSYIRKGFENIDDYKNHLAQYEITISQIRNKILNETLWNELIYKKFSQKVVINKTKLKNKIIEDNDKEIKSFFLSEIVFKTSKTQNLNQKFDIIKKDINEKGFSNAALLHSISNSSVDGGDLGWISERSLNPKIENKIKNLKIGNFTDPIIIPGGFLILKLKELKNEKNKYNVEKKLNELIRISTNQQLNQLSNIYFDKIKKETNISEL